MTMSQAAKKIGTNVRSLSDLGIYENGINLAQLRKSLQSNIPQGTKLREGEIKNFENVLSAIIGRLGNEDVVLGPVLSIVRTMRNPDLSLEQKILALSTYLEEHFKPSHEARGGIYLRAVCHNHAQQPDFLGLSAHLFPPDDPRQKQFFMHTRAIFGEIYSNGTPLMGYYNFEEGAKKIIERLAWVNEFPKMVSVYGVSNSGKSFLIERLRKTLSDMGYAVGGFTGAASLDDFKRIWTGVQNVRSNTIYFFHNGHALFPQSQDPNHWVGAALNREIHLNVGIYNPNLHSKHLITNGLYDMAISNPGSRQK
jgi:hypothetical protein